ncbi:hypothetical protein MBLNU459_g5963t1 [Dothideomycetes sp. NU459]
MSGSVHSVTTGAGYPSPRQSTAPRTDRHDAQEESSSHAGSRDSWPRSSGSLNNHSASNSTRNGNSNNRDDTTPEPSAEHERNGGRLRGLRQRARRSGGFLLDTTLPGRHPASPAGDERRGQTPYQPNGKGKAASGRRPAAPGAQSAASGASPVPSSPLSRHMQRSHTLAPRLSGDLDGAESAQSRHSSRDGSASPLDPAQLVQMALSLSEGRRRHASAGLTVPSAPASDARRIRSAGAPVLSVSPGSPLGNDFLRPRSAPTQPEVPPTPTRPSHDRSEYRGSALRHSRNGAVNDAGISEEEWDENEQREGGVGHVGPVEFQFSAATLNRAERARKFFELSSEYWRLLQNLPPMKSDSTAPGNYTFVTKNTPGSTYPQINRVRSNTDAKHELGREYNPLQLLRNRRIRHREQRPLDPPPEAFDDVLKVKSYIDNVEKDSQHPAYRTVTDTISLPHFRRGSYSEVSQPTPAARGHRRTDTAVSKIARAESDWSFTPAELFADALWLEQDDNKTLAENRHGNRIFPQPARESIESARGDRRSNEGERPLLQPNTSESATVKSDDDNAGRGRKKRKFLSLRKVDTARKNLVGNRSRSTSPSSTSSPAGPERRRRTHQGAGALDLESTGPLERHMRQMMEKEKLQGTPELISPDKWDRHDDIHNVSNHDAGRAAHDEQALNPAKPKHNRQESFKVDTAKIDERGRSSFDDSTAPNSPSVANFIPSIGMSLSPPHSRRGSPERKFGIFKSHSKERQKIDQMDFADSHASLPDPGHAHDQPAESQRPSFDSLRPSTFKRHKTTTSITNAFFKSDSSTPPDRRGSKDTAASNRRFFKSGRIGDLVRSEGSRFGDVIWKKDPRANTFDISDTESDDSVEPEGPRKLKKPPSNLSRTSTSTGGKPKYHIPNLPSFKPQNASKHEDNTSNDPIAQQRQHHREQSRSSRFDRLAPPRIDLPDEDSDVSPGLSRQYTQTSDMTAGTLGDDRRGSYGFLTPLRHNRSIPNSMGAPGSIGYGGNTYMTGLANVDQQAARKMSTMSMQGKRHWSISDRIPRDAETQRVTAQDIDRVRALFLSSGVKAHELCKRGNSVVDPPSDFLVSAASATEQQLHPVTLREEFIVAARMLSKSVSSWSTGLEHDIDNFRSTTVPGLHSRLEELKHRVEEKLTPLVHQTADEADAFTVALTTQQTLAVKQVNDAVDNILRHRRRRLRMLRRAGFAVLEWLVLGLLWVVWFVVIIIKLVKSVVLGFSKATRWVLCL